MKRLLRSVIAFDEGISQEALNSNWLKLKASSLEWTRPDEDRLFKYIKDFFKQRLDVPSVQTVVDYFTQAKDLEVLERIKDIQATPAYSYTNFMHLLTTLLEDQNRIKASALLKTGHEMITRGLEIEGVRYKGTREGLLYIAQHAADLIIPESNAKTRGNFREDAKAVWDNYEAAKHDKSKAWGKFTGLTVIDDACHGIKKGELWVHAGFAGELKSTMAANWCYHLTTRYRANVFYTSLEMKYDHIRLILYVRHSANPKFAMQGYRPLDYRKVRDGELTPEEEAFFQLVVKDYAENPEYCDFDTWAPDHDVNIGDIRTEAELLHRQKEIGLIVVDHGGLAEARKAKKNKDYTIELNSVIRDCKKMALQFNQGEGVPVLLLFQINRDGKDYADKNDGNYKMRSLSYANECLVAGTQVRTDQGLIPIEAVPIGCKVWSSTGWKDVRARFDQGVRPTVLVSTKRGPKITCTPDHLFRVVTPTGLQWVSAKDLKGQCVLADKWDQARYLPSFLEPWKQMYRRHAWPIGDLYTRVYNQYVNHKKHFKGNIPHGEVLSLAFITRLVQKDPDVDMLRQLCMCHSYLVDAVVPAGDFPVFDLEVGGDHEYSTGGFLTHNCERSADVISTTYLNDDLRSQGRAHLCCLKNRDNPLFSPFDVGVDFSTRSLYNLDMPGISVDDTANAMTLLGV